MLLIVSRLRRRLRKVFFRTRESIVWPLDASMLPRITMQWNQSHLGLSASQKSQQVASSQDLTSSAKMRAVAMDPAQRHALILRAWEAVNAERDLRGVLDAVTRILKPVVHFDSLTIVSFDTPEHRLIAY